MTDKTTDETPEDRSDIDIRLTRIEAAISDLRDMIERPNQTSTDETLRHTPVTPDSDRFKAAKTTAQDAFARARDRANDAARGAGLPLWAVIVIGVLAIVGVVDVAT